MYGFAFFGCKPGRVGWAEISSDPVPLTCSVSIGAVVAQNGRDILPEKGLHHPSIGAPPSRWMRHDSSVVTGGCNVPKQIGRHSSFGVA